MTLHTGQDTVVVTPPVEIDIFTHDEFKESLRRACLLDPRRVIVDFSQVTFCDSTALRVLVDEAARLLPAGCLLEIHQPTPELRKMASMLGLSERLGIAPH